MLSPLNPGQFEASGWERQASAWRLPSMINTAELGLGVPGYLSIVPT